MNGQDRTRRADLLAMSRHAALRRDRQRWHRWLRGVVAFKTPKQIVAAMQLPTFGDMS